MRTALLGILCILLLSTAANAQEEVFVTKDGQYVVVRKEERSSSRGWVRIGVAAIMLACGGVAVASQRTFRRPKNNRARTSSTTTTTRKPTRPTFNKPKNRP